MARTAVKFGVFVAVCLSFTLYLAATIGNTTLAGLVGQGPSTYSLSAVFDDVTGLLPNDNVKIAGVVVGKVTGVSVDDGRAVVKMEIEDDAPAVPSDSTAAIRWRNLVGQRYIYLVPGSAATTVADGDMLDQTASVIDLGELFNRLGPIVAAVDPAKVNDFLETVTSALDGNQDEVSKALDDLAVLVSGLGDRDEAIGRLIDNLGTVARTVADRDAQIGQMLTNLTQLSQTFSDNTGLLETAIVELGAFNRDLSQLLADNRSEVDRVLTNVDVLLTAVESQLGPLDNALDGLDEASAAVFRTSRNGEFLNQTILCASVTPPPCATPIVSGLTAATEAEEFTPASHPSGVDAVLSLFGRRS